MNAHADMFIVVQYNELNTPRGIYRSLVLGVGKFPVFVIPKQAPINAFYYVCKLSFALQNYNISLNNARKIIKKSKQPYQIFRKGANNGATANIRVVTEWFRKI